MPTPRPRPSRVLGPVSASVLAGLVLTACGTATIKTDEVESTIAQQFAAKGVRLTDVSCEDGVKAEAGAALRCTALNPAGTKLVLEGRVTKVKGDRGSFQVKAVRGVAKGPVIADQARALLERKVGQKARGMTCPASVPIPTTPSVTCELTTQDGKRYDVTVTIDAQSTLDAQVADTPNR